MNILNITCRESRIVLRTDIPSGTAVVRAYTPASMFSLTFRMGLWYNEP